MIVFLDPKKGLPLHSYFLLHDLNQKGKKSLKSHTPYQESLSVPVLIEVKIKLIIDMDMF